MLKAPKQQRTTEVRCKKPASATLQRYRDFVLQATKYRHGYALQCASTELKDDREIVLETVKQSGY